MFNVEWESQYENIFKAILKIAHYTGFSKNEILNWTTDEINKAIEFIIEEEKRQAVLKFSLVDYNKLINAEPSNKDGSINQAEKDKFNAKSKELRSAFTGEEVENKVNNTRFFAMRSQTVVDEMTLEEFKQFKQNNYGT